VQTIVRSDGQLASHFVELLNKVTSSETWNLDSAQFLQDLNQTLMIWI